MSTVTQTPAGWSFIHKGQRYEYPTRELAREALYDLQHGKAPAPRLDLDNDPVIVFLEALEEQEAEWRDDTDARCVALDTSRPIRVETWQGGGTRLHTWQNFEIGRVTVGVLTDGSKPGIELDIGSNSINGEMSDIWTLDDLRQLRDDLRALLADDRLLAATGAAAAPIRVERRDDLPCPCTEYHARERGVFVEVLDSPDPVAGGDGLTVWNMGSDCADLASAEQDARDLLALLADPRVRAAIEARRAA